MRTSIMLSLTLLVVVLAGGICSAQLTRDISRQYLSAAEELDVLTQDGHWQRAKETAGAYREQWTQKEKWLESICSHEDIYAVSMALGRMLAGIEAQDSSLCAEAAWELRESADRIYSRDALTLGNIL